MVLDILNESSLSLTTGIGASLILVLFSRKIFVDPIRHSNRLKITSQRIC